jgi:RNA polymerase sigma factor (sigma-70 family)
MESMAVVVPPFEAFYEAHKVEVFRFLGRRLGRERAEDAFQETFLRALRAYPRLEHGEHLRAWVLTIASRIVLDDARRKRPPTVGDVAELPELASEDGRRPAFEELAPLTDGLPPKERAAVVLRYGYDLGYDEIGDALGSTESAARQAASAGVRRLRKEQE